MTKGIVVLLEAIKTVLGLIIDPKNLFGLWVVSWLFAFYRGKYNFYKKSLQNGDFEGSFSDFHVEGYKSTSRPAHLYSKNGKIMFLIWNIFCGFVFFKNIVFSYPYS